EVVQVVRAGGRIVAPRAPLFIEEAPSLRRRAPLGRPPVVVVAIRVVTTAAALLKPRMLVAGVVHDQVHDHLDPATLHSPEYRVEVGTRAHLRDDGAVVADVVSVVVVGGLIDRVEPDDVHAQALDVIEARGDAADVTYAITVAVLEASRVDLVHDDFLPPCP